mgnify:CR=1 FL=1
MELQHLYFHGGTFTHFDALCHYSFQGKAFNGLVLKDIVTPGGACAKLAVTGAEAPPLPGLTEAETVRADLWAMGLSVGKHPTELVRPVLTAEGVVTAADLRDGSDRSVVEVAGVVTHRQQPSDRKSTRLNSSHRT